MAKKRNLKRHVNFICSELFAEGVAVSLYKKNVDQNYMNDILSRILYMQDDFLRRLSHVEPGSEKLFYKKYKQDFHQQVDEVLDMIGNVN
jgi:hypothetical protein